MNQIDTGKFIASCRKEKGLTQAQLAEKLNITDRAVSKWETGKCMPDSSIMLELCNILGVTVNELLSGERIEINNYDEKVNENLIELKRNQRIIAGNAQFAGIAAGRGVRFTTGLLLLGKGLGMRETPIRPHS